MSVTYATPHGNAGMGLIVSNLDDETASLLPGFPFWYKGVNLMVSPIVVSGNSWVGFGSETDHLSIDKRDSKCQQLYALNEVINGMQAFRIRWEGSGEYNVVSNNLCWELVLFADNTMVLIIVRTPSYGYDSFDTAGNGLTQYIWLTEASYVLKPSSPSNGTFFTITPGDYIPTQSPAPGNLVARMGQELKSYSEGWVKVDGVSRKIGGIWSKVGGVAKRII